MKHNAEKKKSKVALPRRGIANKHTTVTGSKIAFISSPDATRIQTKLICPCDGGCPRCGLDIQPRPQSFESRVQNLRGKGHALPNSIRSFFDLRLGMDTSQVRCHTDSQAEATARSISARAFTNRRDIVFGSGQYSPETDEGRRLIAHELVHVMQQTGTATREKITKGQSYGQQRGIDISFAPVNLQRVNGCGSFSDLYILWRWEILPSIGEAYVSGASVGEIEALLHKCSVFWNCLFGQPDVRPQLDEQVRRGVSEVRDTLIEARDNMQYQSTAPGVPSLLERAYVLGGSIRDNLDTLASLQSQQRRQGGP